MSSTHHRPTVLRSSIVIASFTMGSRALGFVRDVLLAAILGTGAQADAFIVAFRLPNLFRRLFAEGAFAAAFIPSYIAENTKQEQQIFAGQVLGLITLALAALTILAEIFMEQLVFLLAGGFRADPEKFMLAVLFSRITFPYLIFMFLTALYGALLNAAGRFWASSAAPVLLNVILIICLLAAWDQGALAGFWLSVGVAIAGIAQALMMIFAAWRAKILAWPVRFHLSDNTKNFLLLAAPALAAGGVTQLNIIIGTRIASSAPAAVAHLYYAERLYQLPLAVIGIAIGAALLPDLAQKLSQNQFAAARRALIGALEGALLLTLPAACALLAIAEPTIAALFEYGRFRPADRIASALVLMGFAIGLPAFVLQRLLSSTFFARRDTKRPFYYALIAIIFNVAASLTLFPYWGAVGIAVATSFAAWIYAGLLFFYAARQNWVGWEKANSINLALIASASLFMAAALYVMQYLYMMPDAGWRRAAYLAALVILGLAIYASACHIFKLINWQNLKQGFHRISE